MPVMSLLLIYLLLIRLSEESLLYQNINSTLPDLTYSNRFLGVSEPSNDSCDDTSGYKRYFDAIESIYPPEKQIGTCIPVHKQCGWPSISKSNERLALEQSTLPLLVLSVGLEGAGHHLWTEILEIPVFECVWINGRHYHRDIGDGVPRTTTEKLAECGMRICISTRNPR